MLYWTIEVRYPSAKFRGVTFVHPGPVPKHVNRHNRRLALSEAASIVCGYRPIRLNLRYGGRVQ